MSRFLLCCTSQFRLSRFRRASATVLAGLASIVMAACGGGSAPPDQPPATLSGAFLYVIGSELSSSPPFGESGKISAFKIDPATGGLRALADSPFPVPANSLPASIAVDSGQKFVFVGNFGILDPVTLQEMPNSLSVYKIDTRDGSLKPVPGSPFFLFGPEGQRPIGVYPSADLLYVVTNNVLFGFRVDQQTGLPQFLTGSPFFVGFGPLAIHPSGKFLFAAESRNDLTAVLHTLAINSTTGALSEVVSPISAGVGPISIAVDASGVNVYVVDGGFDGGRVGGFIPPAILGYSFDDSTAGLTPLSGSPVTELPRQMAIDPRGDLVLVSEAGVGSLIYKRSLSGQLTLDQLRFPTGGFSARATFDSSGKFVFIPFSRDPEGGISTYTIDRANGMLVAVPGSPFTVGRQDLGGAAIAGTIP